MVKSFSKSAHIDLGTFGGSKACMVLADMMNQNVISVYQRHRVLSFINTAVWNFKWIGTISEAGVRERSLVLMRDHLYDRIVKMTYPIKFKSYLKNVIAYYYRKNLEGVDLVIAIGDKPIEESRSSAQQPTR